MLLLPRVMLHRLSPTLRRLKRMQRKLSQIPLPHKQMRAKHCWMPLPHKQLPTPQCLCLVELSQVMSLFRGVQLGEPSLL
jgi:hypothetical protein